MKRKLILLLMFSLIICSGLTAFAEGEKSLLGVHWSYTPMFDFVEDAPGTLWSNEYGIVVSVLERPKTGISLEDSANNWLATNQGVTMKRTVYWIHQGMKSVVLEAAYPEKGYELMIYFIETPNSMTEITVAGKENFLPMQKELQDFIKTFTWQEKLSMAGLPYRMDLPEGWELARMSPSTDYYTLDGKDPAMEQVPYLLVYYIKENAGDEDLTKRLNHASMPDYNKFTVVEEEDLTIGEWPARFWFLTVTTEDGSTFNVLACRIATDRFVYNLETFDTAISKETFKQILNSWQFVGNDTIRIFRE